MNNVVAKATDSILNGAWLVYNVVASTFGPNGKNVVIKDGDEIIVTKDGITVANYVRTDNSVEQIGLKLIVDAVNEANNIAGDGSTTTTILAYHFLAKGYEALEKGIKIHFTEFVHKEILPRLSELGRTEYLTEEDLYKLALIPSNNDEALAHMVATIFASKGKDSHIKIKEAITIKGNYFHLAEGFNLRCYITSKFFGDKEGQLDRFRHNEVSISIIDKKIASIKDLEERVEDGLLSNKVFIVHDITPEVIKLLEKNIKLGKIRNFNVVKMPMLRAHTKTILEDLQCYDLSKVSVYYSEDTLTIEDLVINDRVRERASSIRRRLLEDEGDEEELKYLKERYSNILLKNSEITVAGNTQVEIKEKLYRLEDTINAIRGIMTYGPVPGAGKALKTIADSIKDINPYVSSSLSTPYTLLCDSGVNMDDTDGIYDSYKTLSTALTLAATFADTILSSSYSIIYEQQ